MSPYGSELIHVKIGFQVHCRFTSTRTDCTGVLGTEGLGGGGGGGGVRGDGRGAQDGHLDFHTAPELG